MRRTLLPALLGLLLALAVPGAARAQGGEPGPNDSDGGTEYRVPMETRTIYAVLPLKPGDRALSLYRSLVPRGYDMPAEPQVAVYLTEPNVPTRIPGQPYNEYTRWIEGPVAIKVVHKGTEGYYPLIMPVTSRFEYDLGRAAGLPKILVEGGLEETEDGFEVRTTVAGRPAVNLRFRREAVETSEELNAFGRQRFPLFALLPALRGPDLYFTKFTPDPIIPTRGTAPIPPPFVVAEPEPGLVDYEIDPDFDRLDDTLPDLFTARGATFADLVEPRGTVPGLYHDLPQVLRLKSGDIGDGGGYDDAPPPAPASAPPPSALGLPSTRSCKSRRNFTIRLRSVRRGERIRRARIRVDGRRLTRVAGRRARLPIDLRGLPRGRFRITVVAVTTRSRTVTERRTYRTCVPRKKGR